MGWTPDFIVVPFLARAGRRSPAGLRDPGDLAAEGEVAEGDAAEAELAVDGLGAAGQHAAAVLAGGNVRVGLEEAEERRAAPAIRDTKRAPRRAFVRAGEQGFEPQLLGPEPSVLPLDYSPTRRRIVPRRSL